MWLNYDGAVLLMLTAKPNQSSLKLTNNTSKIATFSMFTIDEQSYS